MSGEIEHEKRWSMSGTGLTLSLYFSYIFQIFQILFLYIFILINIKLYLAILIYLLGLYFYN